MLFNSFVFVGFLAIVLPVYYSLSHRWQNRFLVVASYVFYGYWDWRFLGLLALSTCIDYFVALGLDASHDQRRRKSLLLVSICANLGILGFFKYFDFFVESASTLLTSAGLNVNAPLLEIILPVGISFYTFQTLAYTIDVYRGEQKATRDLWAFALYVSYFPQLVAGPIERASRLLPQIQAPRIVTQDQLASGAQLILWGYVKKVVIADGLAPYVDTCFADYRNLSSGALVLGVYAFAFQIYGDFSGYTDIARGVSRLLGIELMENFRQPYWSRNITEFWRRWHISLSTWLRDYLYIPLGGNRQGPRRQYLNLFITMLLGGLWHGAAWTFVIWGGLHGLFLAVHKAITRGRRITAEGPPSGLRDWAVFLVKAVGTFHLVCLTWIFFRSDTGEQAQDFLFTLSSVLFTGDFSMAESLRGLPQTLLVLGGIAALLDFLCWFRVREAPFDRSTPAWVRTFGYAVALLVIAYVREPSGETFIYFQF
ncbi:MAG: O-acyltransferase [Candidatus Hydrogenedentota bacterium]